MNNVSTIRKSRGLSQAELADLVGVEQPTISRVERDSDSVTLRTLKQIAKALGVNVSDLFADRSSAENYLIEAYRSLPEMRRQGWQDMARAVMLEEKSKVSSND